MGLRSIDPLFKVNLVRPNLVRQAATSADRRAASQRLNCLGQCEHVFRLSRLPMREFCALYEQLRPAANGTTPG